MHLIQQLEQGYPTLFLDICRPLGFLSNPNKAHLIQQLEQGCPTLFLDICRPIGFHANPNKSTPHSTARDVIELPISLIRFDKRENLWDGKS